MFSSYSDSELYTLYLSLCQVLHNLRCDQCSGYSNYGGDSGCRYSDFCNSLSIFKREVLDEIGERRIRGFNV
jgi:hypothetical protein